MNRDYIFDLLNQQIAKKNNMQQLYLSMSAWFLYTFFWEKI